MSASIRRQLELLYSLLFALGLIHHKATNLTHQLCDHFILRQEGEKHVKTFCLTQDVCFTRIASRACLRFSFSVGSTVYLISSWREGTDNLANFCISGIKYPRDPPLISMCQHHDWKLKLKPVWKEAGSTSKNCWALCRILITAAQRGEGLLGSSITSLQEERQNLWDGRALPKKITQQNLVFLAPSSFFAACHSLC